MRVLMVSAGCEVRVASSPAIRPLTTYGPPGTSCTSGRGAEVRLGVGHR